MTDSAKPLSRSKQVAELFARQCEQRALPAFEREFVFANSIGRRWRFDFAWPQYRLALEIEGLVVMRIGGQLICKGRHASIGGFKDDCEKYAWATVLGWRVMRFETSQVKDKTAIDMAVRALATLPLVPYVPPISDQTAIVDTPGFEKAFVPKRALKVGQRVRDSRYGFDLVVTDTGVKLEKPPF
jgi:very-short-patch-repair endonuclease